MKKRLALAVQAISLLFIALPSFAQQPLTASPGAGAAGIPAPQATQPQTTANPFQTGTISSLSGEVKVRKVKGLFWQDAKPDQEILTGDQIKTGPKGRAKIEIENGNIIYLKPNSLIVIEELSRNDFTSKYTNIFSANKAKLKAEVNAKADIDTFEIRTPTAVAGVRGTTLYLNIAPRLTDLYVEGGGALLTNPVSGQRQDVPPGMASSADASGSVSAAGPPSAEQKKDAAESWEPAAEAPAGETGDEGQQATQQEKKKDLTDAVRDRQTSDPADAPTGRDNPPPAEESLLDLRREISGMLTEARTREREAAMDKIADAKMGKVITDVNGHQVRFEEYVYRPTGDEVHLISLSKREGTGYDYLDGITSMEFVATFNTSLDALTSQQLRDLDWKTFFAGALAGSIDYGSTQPTYYPKSVSLELKNPTNDSFKQVATYSAPMLSTTWYQMVSHTLSVSGSTPVTLNVSGWAHANPAHLDYNIGSPPAVNMDIYIIDETGAYSPSSYSFDDLFDVLGSNEGGAHNDLGGYMAEIIATSSAWGTRKIDAVLKPPENLDWRTDFKWEGQK